MHARFQILKQMARLMDSQFEGPFGIRYGLDGLLGLLPVFGDFVTSGFSFYLIFESARLGVSVPVLLRMILNVMIDNIMDVIPVVGNLFDFAWRSNDKNIVLLEQHLSNPRSAKRQSQLVLFGVGVLLLGLFAGGVYLSVLIVQKVFELAFP